MTSSRTSPCSYCGEPKECTPCRNGQHCHGKGWAECRCRVCGGHPAVYAQIAPTPAATAMSEQIADWRKAVDDFACGRATAGTLIKYGSNLSDGLMSARREEREACAKACEAEYLKHEPDFDESAYDSGDTSYDMAVSHCAAAIRARSLPETPETGS